MLFGGEDEPEGRFMYLAGDGLILSLPYLRRLPRRNKFFNIRNDILVPKGVQNIIERFDILHHSVLIEHARGWQGTV